MLTIVNPQVYLKRIDGLETQLEQERAMRVDAEEKLMDTEKELQQCKRHLQTTKAELAQERAQRINLEKYLKDAERDLESERELHASSSKCLQETHQSKEAALRAEHQAREAVLRDDYESKEVVLRDEYHSKEATIMESLNKERQRHQGLVNRALQAEKQMRNYRAEALRLAASEKNMGDMLRKERARKEKAEVAKQDLLDELVLALKSGEQTVRVRSEAAVTRPRKRQRHTQEETLKRLHAVQVISDLVRDSPNGLLRVTAPGSKGWTLLQLPTVQVNSSNASRATMIRRNRILDTFLQHLCGALGINQDAVVEQLAAHIKRHKSSDLYKNVHSKAKITSIRTLTIEQVSRIETAMSNNLWRHIKGFLKEECNIQAPSAGKLQEHYDGIYPEFEVGTVGACTVTK